MSVWHTILVFILTEPRGLSSGERCHSLLNILVTHSAWSHLSLACVWLGNPTSKHISGCVFVRHRLLPSGQFFFYKTDTCFQLEVNWWSMFFLSQQKSSWCSLSKPNNNWALLEPPLWTLPKALENRVCTSVPSCTYLIIPINVHWVYSTGSHYFWIGELARRWQVPLWFLPQQNDGWVINGDLWPG